MSTKTRKNYDGNFEKSFVKNMKKISREIYGISPVIVFKNRKKYFRKKSKSDFKKELEKDLE